MLQSFKSIVYFSGPIWAGITINKVMFQSEMDIDQPDWYNYNKRIVHFSYFVIYTIFNKSNLLILYAYFLASRGRLWERKR